MSGTTDAYPDRFVALLAERGQPAVVLQGTAYTLYQRMVVPFGPAGRAYSLPAEDAARALRSLGGICVRTTGGFRPSRAGRDEWWAVICRRFTEPDDVPSSNTRSKLRRALRRCHVHRLAPHELARTGYEVYRKALERHGPTAAPMSRPAFEAYALAAEGFEDIVESWGVFVEGQLAGFCDTYVFGATEANYATIRLDPDHLGRYTSYALLHEMNRHYLAERRIEYVNDGFRSILHATSIQEFLEHQFAFERAYSDVRLTWAAPYGALMRLTFPARRALGRLDPRLRALYELERISRA
jgi:hypothetical protein